MALGFVAVAVLTASGCGGCDHTAASADSNGGGDDDAPPGTLTIQPASYLVPVGRSMTFVSAGATAWNVTETGGGTVDAAGVYTAPLAPGTYHLVASDGIASATATVTVADFQLAVLSGAVGGNGYVDAAGTDARFDTPLFLASVGAGGIFVAEAGSHTVRRLDLTSGAVTTFAGTPAVHTTVDGVGTAAGFASPSGLAFDSTTDTLYVSDSVDHVIRAIDVASRAVTTIAGQPGVPGSASGTGSGSQFHNPWGLALDGFGGMFIADTGNCTLRHLVLATNTVDNTLGSVGVCTGVDSPSATYDHPTGIVSVSGNLYVTDTYAVRLVSEFGTVSKSGRAVTCGYADLFGTSARFGSLQQIVSDGAGGLYVADLGASAVRRFDISSQQVTTVAGGTMNVLGDLRFVYPVGLVSLPGELIVDDADAYHAVVRSIALTTGTVSNLAGLPEHAGEATGAFTSSSFDVPVGLASDGHGKLVVIDSEDGVVRMLDLGARTTAILAGASGNPVRDGTGTVAGFGPPDSPAFDPATELVYVPDDYANGIRQITTPAGVVTTPFSDLTMPVPGFVNGSHTASRFSNPGDAVVVGGTLYVNDRGNHAIRAIDLASATASTLAGGMEGQTDGVGTAAAFEYVSAMGSDATSLYVADVTRTAMFAEIGTTIRRIDLATGTVTTIVGSTTAHGAGDGLGSAATFDEPTAIAWDGDQTLYIADISCTIRRIYLPTGAVSTFAGTPYFCGPRLGSVATAQLPQTGGLVLVDARTFYFVGLNENAVFALTQQ